MDALPRLRWPTLFQENAKPLFVLNRARRLRFVNAAFEALSGESASNLLGRACLRKGPTEPLFRTLAPPGELATKPTATVRRPAPSHANGPPWWDITFIKLTDTAGHAGTLGIIEVVTPPPGTPAKSLSPFLGSLVKKTSERFTFDLFAGATLEAERFQAQLRHAADSSAPVWIHGEPGLGKETAARVIHHNGHQREKPFVKIDCAALQPYLIEAVLFGSGGLALAARIGTLFLKAPAALPRDLQQKLSDWLRHAAHAPRVISSSRTLAAEEAAGGTLRPEYATALAVLELAPLPLRQRLDDLPRIAERVLADLGLAMTLDDAQRKILRAHRWPGNFKELREALSHLPLGLPRYLREQSLLDEPTAKVPRPSLDAILEAVEKKLLSQALAACNGNHTEAAQRLGIVRTRLLRRIAALGLE